MQRDRRRARWTCGSWRTEDETERDEERRARADGRGRSVGDDDVAPLLDELCGLDVIGVLAQFVAGQAEEFGHLLDRRREGTRCSRMKSAAMATSFSRSASLKVRGKARVTTRCGIRFSDVFERPLDALITSSAADGFTPALVSAASPSAADQMCTASSALFTAFRACAGADGADEDDLLAEGLEHGAGAREGDVVTAAHDRQRAGLGPGHAAAHRRVDEGDPALGETRGDAARRAPGRRRCSR